MNTITNSMVPMAMDGQSLYNAKKNSNKSSQTNESSTNITSPDCAEVVQNIKQSIEETKADTLELQKLSELITGRKLHFNFNKELKSVVVSIVDPNTNQVVKEIPSEDMQKLKLRLRKQIGSMYDQMI